MLQRTSSDSSARAQSSSVVWFAGLKEPAGIMYIMALAAWAYSRISVTCVQQQGCGDGLLAAGGLMAACAYDALV